MFEAKHKVEAQCIFGMKSYARVEMKSICKTRRTGKDWKLPKWNVSFENSKITRQLWLDDAWINYSRSWRKTGTTRGKQWRLETVQQDTTVSNSNLRSGARSRSSCRKWKPSIQMLKREEQIWLRAFWKKTGTMKTASMQCLQSEEEGKWREICRNICTKIACQSKPCSPPRWLNSEF